MSDTRRNIAVLFGGRSVEHEISVITAIQLMNVIDITRYNIVPVYIAPNGRWFTGKVLLEREFYRDLPSCLAQLDEVTLLPRPGVGGLTLLRRGSRTAGSWLDDVFARHAVMPVDVYVTSFHGEYGEDGAIQGLLELVDAPYTGCNVLSSALAMDKYLCKSVLRDHNIPVLPAVLLEKFEAVRDLKAAREKVLADKDLGSFPLFVKPCHLGSSIGISKATNSAELDSALAKVFRHDSKAIVEPFLGEMFEVNVSVLDADTPEASVVEIPVADAGFLSYEDKYLREGGKKKGANQSGGMANLTREINPEHLDSAIRDKIVGYALEAHRILGCSGVVRFDFMVNLADQQIYFNELNPQPGSFSFYLWVESEPPVLYTELATRMIERAVECFSERASLQKELEFRALK